MEHPVIDTHCHLFHKGYLTRRILFSLVNLMSDIEKVTVDKEKRHKLSVNLSSALKRTVQVMSLINSSSSEEVLHKLEKNYNGYNVIYAPLSYDLISCFQESYNVVLQELSLRKEHDYLENIKTEIIFYLDKQIHVIDKLKLTSHLFSIYHKIEELLEKEKHNFLNKKNQPFDNTNIFFYQLNELLDLKKKYPDRVYPFLYIDPRRMTYFQDFRDLLGKDKPFLGVKLYTPNGYSPLDPNLMEVYAYCEQEEIPITVHNAYGGFSNFVKKLDIKGGFYDNGMVRWHDGWIEFETDFFSNPRKAILERADKLNHPRLWAEVLRKFPRLKLNLAHFGGDGKHWQPEIFKLLVDYPNVYTDLSCQTERQMLEYIRRKYFRKLEEKFLYGSDYYLNMFFIDDFRHYWYNFYHTFNKSEKQILMFDNPVRFLFNSQTKDLFL